MAKIKISKVISTLPGTLVPNTIYLVRTGVGFDIHVVDSTGSTAHTLNVSGASGITEQQVLARVFIN